MIKVVATLDGYSQTINDNVERITGSISQEVGAIHSFTFDILPSNKGYDLIQSRRTLIRAVNTITGRVEFSGRVLLAEEKMSNTGAVSKSVTCESLLGYLYDSIQPFKAEDNHTLNDFIDLVLTNHNERVEEEKRIYRGEVNVDVAATGYVYKGLQYQTTFETLKTKLVDVYGGELEVVEKDGKLLLNYLKEIGYTRSTKIKLGRNMQSASRQVSPLNIITRVIPLGAKLKQTVENDDGSITEVETEERLSLVGYVTPEGVTMTEPWVDDTEKIKNIGIVCGVLDCSDVTEQSNLYKRAVEHMTKENRVELSHTLTALDLREIGQDIDSLNCGDSYRVENELIGLNETLRITKKTIDIQAPYKGNITIGEKKATLTKIQASETEKIKTQLENIASSMQSMSNATNINSTKFEKLSASLSSTIGNIVTEALASYVTASELGSIREDIQYKAVEDAKGLLQTFEKETFTSAISDVDGKITTQFEELKAYIRYYMDENGSPVIELGKIDENGNVESEVITRIKNDRWSFYEGDYEVAYVNKSTFNITDGAIKRRLIIGNYAAEPRNDGGIVLFKMGG